MRYLAKPFNRWQESAFYYSASAVWELMSADTVIGHAVVRRRNFGAHGIFYVRNPYRVRSTGWA